MLWPLGRSKGLFEPPFVQGRSNGLLEPLLGAPKVLERAARAPARCPQGTRRGCSSTCSVPQGRFRGLLKPAQCPRMLQVAVQASCLYHRCAQSGISSPVPERSMRRSRMLLEESVLGYIHCTLVHTTPCMDMHGFTLIYIYIY